MIHTYDIGAVAQEIDWLMANHEPGDPVVETAINLWCRLTGLARDEAIDRMVRIVVRGGESAVSPPWANAT